MGGDKGGGAVSKGSVIVLEQLMAQSPVWLSLSGTAIKVYHLFRCKCRVAKRSRRPAKRSEGLMERILNNGEIEFTYKEAEQQYGITRGRFVRAIDELIEKGFLDITEPGGGVHKLKTLYAISERWRDYGTSAFQKARRPERSIKCGFRKGNKLWLKAREKKSTAIRAHGGASAMRKNAHGEILAMRTDAHGKKVVSRYIYRRDKGLCVQIA
jgi:DNA-binding PadR family transcriptional regulator